MKLGTFGGANTENHSIGVVTGWLEALIGDEERECEKSTSVQRRARLERSQEALQALYDVSDWALRKK